MGRKKNESLITIAKKNRIEGCKNGTSKNIFSSTATPLFLMMMMWTIIKILCNFRIHSPVLILGSNRQTNLSIPFFLDTNQSHLFFLYLFWVKVTQKLHRPRSSLTGKDVRLKLNLGFRSETLKRGRHVLSKWAFFTKQGK